MSRGSVGIEVHSLRAYSCRTYLSLHHHFQKVHGLFSGLHFGGIEAVSSVCELYDVVRRVSHGLIVGGAKVFQRLRKRSSCLGKYKGDWSVKNKN